MNVTSTIALTFGLLTTMLLAGIASAFAGYTLGHEALKGVTQPDSNPTQSFTDNESSANVSQALNFVNERTLLVKVYDHIHSKEQETDKAQASTPQQTAETPKTTDASEETPKAEEETVFSPPQSGPRGDLRGG